MWIEGGGRVIRSMIAIGKLDVLELALIPAVLGEGVPLLSNEQERTADEPLAEHSQDMRRRGP